MTTGGTGFEYAIERQGQQGLRFLCAKRSCQTTPCKLKTTVCDREGREARIEITVCEEQLSSDTMRVENKCMRSREKGARIEVTVCKEQLLDDTMQVENSSLRSWNRYLQ